MSKNYIKAAMVYTSIVIGAGFASGQEILSYFVEYGTRGFLGIILSSIVFASTGWAVWSICLKENIYTYKHFMDKAVGIKFAAVIEIVLCLFMFVVYAAMLAAAGASMKEAFGLNVSAGIYISATMCFIVFLYDMNGILKLNTFLAPIMILGCVFIGLYTYAVKSEDVFTGITAVSSLMKRNWWMAALTYAAYNIIPAIPVLASMKGALASMKDTFKAGLLSAALLALLGLSIAASLVKHYDLAYGYEIPMLKLASEYGIYLEYGFIILFILAVFTTAATNGYAVVEALSGRYELNKFLLKLLISFLGIISAYMGFSNLVVNIYPLFAIAGIAEIVLILRYFVIRIFGGKG